MPRKYDDLMGVVAGMEMQNDLRRVAQQLGVGTLSERLYDHNGGRFHSSSICKRFGTWNAALTSTGLQVTLLQNTTKQHMLAEMRRVARLLGGGGLSAAEYRRLGGCIHNKTIARRFGSWKKALAAAKLSSWVRPHVTAEVLLNDMQRVARKLHAATLSYPQYQKAGGLYSGKTFRDKIGGWNTVLKHASLQPFKQVHIGHGLQGVPLDELLADLKRVARILGRTAITGPQYAANGGRVTHHTLADRFGSWKAALKAAGLTQWYDPGYSPAELTADISRVAARHCVLTLSRRQYQAWGGRFSDPAMRRHFSGWAAALKAAGLEPSTSPPPARQSLIDDLKRVARSLKMETITQPEYRRGGGRFHPASVAQTIGTWGMALRAAGLKSRAQRGKIPVSREEVIHDLIRIAALTKGAPFSAELYRALGGRFHHQTVRRHFKPWKSALLAAGVDLEQPAIIPPEPKPPKTGISRQSVIDELTRILGKTGGQPLSKRAYQDRGGRVPISAIMRHFGRWHRAVDSACRRLARK